MLVLIPSLFILIALCWFTRKSRMGSAARLLHLALGLVGILSLSFYSWSHEFSGDGINIAVLYHLTANLTGAGYSEFREVILRQMLMLIGAVAVWVWASTKKTPRLEGGAALRGIGLAAAWGLFWAANPTVWSLVRLAPALAARQESASAAHSSDWSDSYARLGLKKPGARNPSHPIRNLVWVYAESLERTYLDEKLFPGLLPQLKQLASEALDFTGVHSLQGSTWTIGGIVGSQCGVPLMSSLSGLGGNDMGRMGNFLPGARCLSDHLVSQGYRMHFLGGADSAFAGKGLFFKDHNYTEVGDLHSLSRWVGEITSSWGLYDDRIFEISGQRYTQLKAKGHPFGLVTLTLDTHHPQGHTTPLCKGSQYRDGSNAMLNSVHCADRMISDYVRRIRAQDTERDTLIVVSSDHLAMPNDAFGLLGKGKRTNLVLVFTPEGPAHLEPRKVTREGSTLDLGTTILGLMGHGEPSLGMGKDLLGAEKTLVESLGGRAKADEFLIARSEAFGGLWALPSFPKGELLIDPFRRKVTFGGSEFSVPALMVGSGGGKQGERIEEILFSSSELRNLKERFHAIAPDKSVIWIDSCAEMGAPFPARFCLNLRPPHQASLVRPVKGLAKVAL